MLYAFLPPLHRPMANDAIGRPIVGQASSLSAGLPAPGSFSGKMPGVTGWKPALLFTLLAALGTLILLVIRPPVFDHSTETLRPKRSSAYAALDEMKRRLGLTQEPLWLLVPGRDEREVAQRLAAVRPALEHAIDDKLISSFTLPSQLWPNPDYQAANRPALHELLNWRKALRRAALGVPLEFPREATDLIHARSGGVPRLINVIADAVLVFGYAEERRVFDRALIEEVLAELETTGVLPRPTATAAVSHTIPIDSLNVALEQREARIRQRELELAEQRRVLAEESRLLRARRQTPEPAAVPFPKAVATPYAAEGDDTFWSWLKRIMLGVPTS